MKLKELIIDCFDDLPRGQKKVASYVLDYSQKIAVSTAREIGETIGVSETTVIRFSHSLSFSGYAELQKTIRGQLLSKQSSLLTYQQSKLEIEKEPHFFSKVMEQDRVAIEETIKLIREEDYEKAIDRLSKAETVFILGLRSSYMAANWLSYTLGLVRGNVRHITPDSEDIIRTISQMDDKTVLIVISFHRYLKETIEIAALAHRQKVYIIGITDSRLAPIHKYSQVLFPVYSPNKSTIDATASLFSFMNSIVAGLAVEEKGNFKERQDRYQALDNNSLFGKGAE